MKKREVMKSSIVMIFAMLVLSDAQGAELTGTYKKRKQKKGYTAYLKVDTRAPDTITRRIEVSDNIPDSLSDGSRIWIKGKIITSLSGNPDLPRGSTQQPPRWKISFVVKKWEKIPKPFARPEGESQDE